MGPWHGSSDLVPFQPLPFTGENDDELETEAEHKARYEAYRDLARYQLLDVGEDEASTPFGRRIRPDCCPHIVVCTNLAFFVG